LAITIIYSSLLGIMKNKLSTTILAGSLFLWNSGAIAWEDTKGVVILGAERTTLTTGWKVATALDGAEPGALDIKDRALAFLSTNPWADTPEEEKQKIKAIFLKHVGHELGDEEIERLVVLLQKKEVKDSFYSLLKKEKTWQIGSLILALLLWLGYGYAYRVQIIGQIRHNRRVNSTSFTTFWTISGMMTVLNGFVPWSLVYLESFLLAFASVAIESHNSKSTALDPVLDIVPDSISDEDRLLREFVENIPFPMVQYSKTGFPLIWNRQMEVETGYNYAEVEKYYQEHGEVMTLLYKWENLAKVIEYLGQIKETGEGYSNVAFTMDTKTWEEKTFLWTTFPYKNNSSLRIAKPLLDSDEKRIELEKTVQLLRTNTLTDALTGAYNRRALDEDLANLLSEQKREMDSKNIVMVMIDIDDFKNLNDRNGHETGDFVLKEFSHFVRANLREEDRFYRFWWDEFVILLKNTCVSEIMGKLNKIRQDFFDKQITTKSVGSSWGGMEFKSGKYPPLETVAIIQKIRKEADKYMYIVKSYKLIEDSLICQWKIKKGYMEKNGVCCPIFDSKNVLIGARVMNGQGIFELTLDEMKDIAECQSSKSHARI
jgi:diguanylate cyclase (GGDEF)-like protein